MSRKKVQKMPKSDKPIKSYIETNIDADLQINKIEVGANCPDVRTVPEENFILNT